MTLSANREVSHYVDQELRSYAVEASAHIYKGAFVGLSADGHAQPLTAGDVCIGIAYEECDNSAGSDGDKNVRVYTLGDFEHALAGSTKANIGDAVYASADDTLTFTSTSNSFVGRCADVEPAGTIILRLEVFNPTP